MRRIEPGSIIVAADGSPDSNRAVTWAAEQAALERRPLVVATAALPIPVVVGAGPGALAVPYPASDALAAAREIADGAVALAHGHRPGVSVGGLAALGDPQNLLVDLSADAHLLVLGSRGRGPVASKLLGSVSAGVSRHAACPTVVCRPGPARATGEGIVVAADGSPESLPVIDFAFHLAALRSRPLTVVHCFWDALASPWEAQEAPAEPGTTEQQLLLAESVAGFRERYPEVDSTLATVRGSAEKYLSGLDGYDVVVIGRHPVDSLTRRVSRVTSTSVLERARTDVAVVPESSPEDADHS